MSDKLYEAFRICLAEGLFTIREDDIFEYLDSKGYVQGTAKRDQAIDAYMKIIKDPILGQMVLESASSLTAENIKELYNEKKRQMGLGDISESKPAVEPTASVVEQVAPVTPAAETQASVVEQSAPVVTPIVPTINKIQENELKVANTEAVMGNTTIIPDVKIPADVSVTPEPKKENSNTKTLQKTNEKEVITTRGYANIVLMSIIVIIIVAIICVFIFM